MHGGLCDQGSQIEAAGRMSIAYSGDVDHPIWSKAITWDENYAGHMIVPQVIGMLSASEIGDIFLSVFFNIGSRA